MSPGLGIAGALRAPKRQHFLIGIELQRSGTRGVCVILWIIAKACRKLAAKNIQISFIYAAFYNLFFFGYISLETLGSYFAYADSDAETDADADTDTIADF